MDRRNVLIGGTALVGATALGGVYVASNEAHIRGWMEEIIRRHLPDINIHPAGLASFVSDKMREVGSNPTYRIYAASVSVGADVTALSEAIRDKIDSFEREAVSDFLLSSNFFHLDDPRSGPVIYETQPDGPGACQNPFAILDE